MLKRNGARQPPDPITCCAEQYRVPQDLVRRLRLLGLEPLVVPEKFVAESLADALGQRFREGERFLMLRSDIARPALRDALRGMGAVCDDIPIYQTALPDPLPDDVLTRL